MKTTDRPCLALAIALALATPMVTGGARAGGTELDKANARKLFNEGLDLRKAGDQPGALAKFVAADALVPTPKGRLELGRQRVNMGMLVEGHATLLSVAELKTDPKDEPKYAPQRAEAAKLAAEVEIRIPTLRVELVGTATVQLDGVTMPTAALSQPLSLNPGTHAITASAEGIPPQRQEIALAEGEHKTVTVKLPSGKPTSEDPPPTGAGGPTPVALHSSSASPVPPHPDADPSADLGTQRTVALVAGGLGVIALGVGAWAGFSARSYRDQATPRCAYTGGGCDAEGLALKAKALDRADLSTWAFVSTAVLLGGAAVIWFTAPSGPPRPLTASLGLLVGVGSVGLAGAF